MEARCREKEHRSRGSTQGERLHSGDAQDEVEKMADGMS